MAAFSPCIPSANCLAHLAAALPSLPLACAPFAAGEALFSAFGVFDGHGGRQVATFASNSLLKAVMAEVDASPIPLQVRSAICLALGLCLGLCLWFDLILATQVLLKHACHTPCGICPTAAPASSYTRPGRPQEVPEVEGLSPEDAARWRLQATLMKRLPQACATAFRSVDTDAQCRWPQRGGSTATLAVACGWELLVANVGDSCAYLDTGSEVLQVGG
jgi:hypothetical protein